MVLVPRRSGVVRHDRAASRRLQRRKKPYKVVFESVTQEKKKLRSAVSYTVNAPPGYDFVEVGLPELSEFCKELCRKRGLTVHLVSATPKNKASIQPEKISHHLHRIGYHFPNEVVDQACDWLGYTYKNGTYRKDVSSLDTSRLAKSLARHKKKGKGVDSESKEQIASAIRDLFPKIPDRDLNGIVTHAFREGTGRVGNVADLTLARRVQLAVVAHIRHGYTDYDKLLKTGTYFDARAAVEQPCLDQLKLWRGENEDAEPELEDAFRETIVIDSDSDDDDVSSDDNGSVTSAERAPSMEIFSSRAQEQDLQPQEYASVHYTRDPRDLRRRRRIIAQAPAYLPSSYVLRAPQMPAPQTTVRYVRRVYDGPSEATIPTPRERGHIPPRPYHGESGYSRPTETSGAVYIRRPTRDGYYESMLTPSHSTIAQTRDAYGVPQRAFATPEPIQTRSTARENVLRRAPVPLSEHESGPGTTPQVSSTPYAHTGLHTAYPEERRLTMQEPRSHSSYLRAVRDDHVPFSPTKDQDKPIPSIEEDAQSSIASRSGHLQRRDDRVPIRDSPPRYFASAADERDYVYPSQPGLRGSRTMPYDSGSTLGDKRKRAVGPLDARMRDAHDQEQPPRAGYYEDLRPQDIVYSMSRPQPERDDNERVYVYVDAEGRRLEPRTHGRERATSPYQDYHSPSDSIVYRRPPPHLSRPDVLPADAPMGTTADFRANGRHHTGHERHMDVDMNPIPARDHYGANREAFSRNEHVPYGYHPRVRELDDEAPEMYRPLLRAHGRNPSGHDRTALQTLEHHTSRRTRSDPIVVDDASPPPRPQQPTQARQPQRKVPTGPANPKRKNKRQEASDNAPSHAHHSRPRPKVMDYDRPPPSRGNNAEPIPGRLGEQAVADSLADNY